MQSNINTSPKISAEKRSFLIHIGGFLILVIFLIVSWMLGFYQSFIFIPFTLGIAGFFLFDSGLRLLRQDGLSKLERTRVIQDNDRDLFDDLPVPMIKLTSEGKIIHANFAVLKLLGRPDISGRNISDLVEGLGRTIMDRIADTTRGFGIGRPEMARFNLDGHEVYIQLTMSPMTHNDSSCILLTLSDATELKTLEAQFVQSQKMQAVGQLAGGVAHDFNNILTAISGHADLLLQRHDSKHLDYEDLVQIKQNSNRAAALIRQLLAFSRKQTLRPKSLHLDDTLSELSHLLNRLLGEKVGLLTEHGKNLRPVRVDERQFEQVIMNLVVNARDAMPEGGTVVITTGNLTLKTEMQRDRATVNPGDYVIVEVKDTGTGISSDTISKIFEPFYTTKKVGEGTGLGLSTVYGIVKQTGGFVFVDSEIGVGTCFTIYLPVNDDVDVVEPKPVAKPVSGDLTGRGKVLLVEDEAPVRSFAARALSLRGYTVVEADSGEAALETLANTTDIFDIFVSDVIMPGIDGPTWVRKALKTHPGTKVVFVSGYAEDAFENGQDGLEDAAFLPKPFSLTDLTKTVKDLLAS